MDMTPPDGPENSRAFIPKRDDMKDKGKKIIVMIVNIMIALPCVTLSSARASAALASMMLACCCLRLRRSFSYGGISECCINHYKVVLHDLLFLLYYSLNPEVR